MGDLSEHISEAVIDAMSVTETDLDDQKIYDIVCKMERQGIETIKTMPVNNQWGYVLQDIFTNIKKWQFYEEHGQKYISFPQVLHDAIQSAIEEACRLADMKHSCNNYRDMSSLWRPVIDEWDAHLFHIYAYFKKRLMRGPYEALRMVGLLYYQPISQLYLRELESFFYTDGYGSQGSTTPETDPAAAILCLVKCSCNIVPDADTPEFSKHTSRTIIIINYINQLCSYYARKLKELHGVNS